jgi:hypothetical protein
LTQQPVDKLSVKSSQIITSTARLNRTVDFIERAAGLRHRRHDPRFADFRHFRMTAASLKPPKLHSNIRARAKSGFDTFSL